MGGGEHVCVCRMGTWDEMRVIGHGYLVYTLHKTQGGI